MVTNSKIFNQTHLRELDEEIQWSEKHGYEVNTKLTESIPQSQEILGIPTEPGHRAIVSVLGNEMSPHFDCTIRQEAHVAWNT